MLDGASAQFRWFLEVLDIVQVTAKLRYGDTIDELKAQCESTGNFIELESLFEGALKIVGPQATYVGDYYLWEEARRRGETNQSFVEWRKARVAKHPPALTQQLSTLYFNLKRDIDKGRASESFAPYNPVIWRIEAMERDYPELLKEYERMKKG